MWDLCIPPGRASLALDLLEELRQVLADRFVLTLINRKMVAKKDFSKKEVITHLYLEEKVEWGMVPFARAMLLARCPRGDLDEYPPFFGNRWRHGLGGVGCWF